MELISTASSSGSNAPLCPSETTLQAFNSTTALLTSADCASSTTIGLVEAANSDALVLNATSMGVVHYVHAADLRATALYVTMKICLVFLDT